MNQTGRGDRGGLFLRPRLTIREDLFVVSAANGFLEA